MRTGNMKGQPASVNQMKLARGDIFGRRIVRNCDKIGTRKPVFWQSSGYTDSIDLFRYVLSQVDIVVNCYSESAVSWAQFDAFLMRLPQTQIRHFNSVANILTPNAVAEQYSVKEC